MNHRVIARLFEPLEQRKTIFQSIRRLMLGSEFILGLIIFTFIVLYYKFSWFPYDVFIKILIVLFGFVTLFLFILIITVFPVAIVDASRNDNVRVRKRFYAEGFLYGFLIIVIIGVSAYLAQTITSQDNIQWTLVVAIIKILGGLISSIFGSFGIFATSMLIVNNLERRIKRYSRALAVMSYYSGAHYAYGGTTSFTHFISQAKEKYSGDVQQCSRQIVRAKIVELIDVMIYIARDLYEGLVRYGSIPRYESYRIVLAEYVHEKFKKEFRKRAGVYYESLDDYIYHSDEIRNFKKKVRSAIKEIIVYLLKRKRLFVKRKEEMTLKRSFLFGRPLEEFEEIAFRALIEEKMLPTVYIHQQSNYLFKRFLLGMFMVIFFSIFSTLISLGVFNFFIIFLEDLIRSYIGTYMPFLMGVRA